MLQLDVNMLLMNEKKNRVDVAKLCGCGANSLACRLY